MIVYKGIKHNILNDAPFIGALIIAPTCRKECNGCFNQKLRDEPNKKNTASEIIDQVKDNSLNKGIILAGLEWSESPEGMFELTRNALDNEMEVIIYTHLTKKSFLDKFPSFTGKPIYIKFGEYDEEQLSSTHESYGVKLASVNQKIEYLKGE